MRPRFRLPFHVSPIVLALLSLMLGQAASAQYLDLRSPRIHQLWTDLQTGTPNAEANFLASLKDGTPLVEPAPVNPAHPELVQSLVTFLWQGTAETRKVLVQGGRPMDAEIPLAKLPGTQIWYRTDLLPSDARFVYYTSLDANADIPDQSQELRMLKSIAVDPLNPRKVGEGDDAVSYVVLPQATPFPYRAKADTPKGRIVDETFTSPVLKDKIALKVYLPAKPVAKGSRPWLLVAFDAGFEDMGTVLDDLIASGMIQPLVAIGIVNRDGQRPIDLGYSDPFAKFVADELIPWARKTYRTSESRSKTIIGGLSRGAGMASYVGLHYPHRISKVISLSTALENFPGAFPPARFWLTGDNGWLIDRYMERPHQPLEFYLAVGRLDTGPWTERLVNNRRFRDVLRLKGYKVHYNEWNGGHDPLFWQRGFIEGLTALAPGPR